MQSCPRSSASALLPASAMAYRRRPGSCATSASAKDEVGVTATGEGRGETLSRTTSPDWWSGFASSCRKSRDTAHCILTQPIWGDSSLLQPPILSQTLPGSYLFHGQLRHWRMPAEAPEKP